jgi:hypothetical protein
VQESSGSVVITGAFSYTGKYATQLLLGRGHGIRTLTFHPQRTNPFGESVQVFRYNFDHPDQLTQTLRGASALINTYWRVAQPSVLVSPLVAQSKLQGTHDTMMPLMASTTNRGWRIARRGERAWLSCPLHLSFDPTRLLD